MIRGSDLLLDRTISEHTQIKAMSAANDARAQAVNKYRRKFLEHKELETKVKSSTVRWFASCRCLCRQIVLHFLIVHRSLNLEQQIPVDFVLLFAFLVVREKLRQYQADYDKNSHI